MKQKKAQLVITALALGFGRNTYAFFGGQCFAGSLYQLPIALFGIPLIALAVWYFLDKRVRLHSGKPRSLRAIVWRALALLIFLLNLATWYYFLADGCSIADLLK